MDTFERWFTQDLNKPILPQHGQGLVFTGDDGTPLVGVHVTRNGAPADLSGTVSCTVIRADGTTVPVTGGTISGGDVSVVLSSACFNIRGPIGVALAVTSGSTTMTVLKAVFQVDITSTGNIIDPSGEITLDVANLIADIDAAVASIPADYSDLLAAIAPPFSASTAYAAGAYVWYNGNLYRFTVAHAAGAWTGTDAAQVALAGDVADLKSAFDENTLKNYIGYEFTVENQRITEAGTAVSDNTTNRTNYIVCNAGDVVSWHGMSYIYAGESVMSLIAFYDKGKNFISGITTVDNETANKEGTLFAVAPTNTAFVVGSTKKNIADNFLRVQQITDGMAFSAIKGFDPLANETRKTIYGDYDICIISDGSVQNPANAFVVNTTTRITVKSGETIRLYIGRPLPDGHRYAFGYTLYDSDGNVIKSESAQTTVGSILNIENDGYIVYNIGEVDSSNNFVVLRSTDFRDSVVLLIHIESGLIAKKSVDKLYDFTYGRSLLCNLQDGTVPNPANTYAVCTSFIPVYAGDTVELKIAKKLPSNGERYVYGIGIFDNNKAYIENIALERFTTKIHIYQDGYVRFSIAVKPKTGSLGDIVLRADDFWPGDVVAVFAEPGSASNAIEAYPAYWTIKVRSAIDKVVQNRVNAEGTMAECFFVTDVHWRYNAQNSSALIANLSKELDIPLVLMGGDVVGQENATKNGAGEELRLYFGSFPEWVNVLPTLGNHDSNFNNTGDSAKKLSESAIYNLMFKCSERFTNTSGDIDLFVYDNESLKVRYIQYKGYNYRDTYDQDFADRIVAEIREKGFDWTIVILSHAYFPDGDWNSGKMYADYILSNYDSCDATIACMLVGHNHNDQTTVITTSGGKDIRIISTVCDACYLENSAGLEMVGGTDTEQAFDIVQIDLTAKSIHLTRVGAGSDRNFNY